MIYKRKPMHHIDAEQFVSIKCVPRGVFIDEIGFCVITIHNQKVYVEPSDWIVMEYDSIHYYPIKDKVFKQLYEPVN